MLRDIFAFDGAPAAFTASLDWLEELQVALDEHLTRLAVALDSEPWDGITGVPFCGCDTCWSRESIALIVPAVLAAVRDGLVEEVPNK